MEAVALHLPKTEKVRGSVREKQSQRGLFTFIFFVIVSLIAIGLDGPPRPVSKEAPPSAFSAERAMAHLAVIGRAPHPTNSAEHDVVRDYIVHTLEGMGIAPQVQKTTDTNRSLGSEGAIENIACRLKGTSQEKAVLIVAHYDSVAAGPGANDDGVAVAAFLEAARALKSLPQPKRDIIFLFTDGEERGLLGARAFVSEHPWAHDVSVVLNFEARGTSGPSIMFETSDENGWLISNFGQGASHPTANSLSYEIYRRMPNSTDFTIFRRAGYSGLNFAYIGGLAYYHTALDSIPHVNLGNLQHHGDYVLEMARQFGNVTLGDPKSANSIYFDVLGSVLVRYSRSTAFAFLGLTGLLTALVVYLGLRNKRLRTGACVLGLIGMITGVVITILGAWVISWIAFQMEQIPRIRAGLSYHSEWYILASSAVGVACGMAFYTWTSKKLGPDNLMVGVFLGWLGITIGVSVYFPGGTYLFLWPLLFGVLGAIVVFARERTSASSRLPVLALSGIPAIILMVPMVHKIYWAFAAHSAVLVGALLGLLLSLLVGAITEKQGARHLSLPVMLAIAGAGSFIIAIALSGTA